MYAAGCSDGSVRVWEVRSRKVAREPFMSKTPVESIAIPPDNRWLASANKPGNTIQLWNLHADSPDSMDYKLELKDSDAASGFSPGAFSSDGKRIVSSKGYNSVKVWDVDSTTMCISETSKQVRRDILFRGILTPSHQLPSQLTIRESSLAQ